MAIITTLTNNNGNKVYPITSTQCVIDKDGKPISETINKITSDIETVLTNILES